MENFFCRVQAFLRCEDGTVQCMTLERANRDQLARLCLMFSDLETFDCKALIIEPLPAYFDFSDADDLESIDSVLKHKVSSQ